MEFSEHGRIEFFKAFIAAQSEMDGAKKTSENGGFKGAKYAALEAVCEAVMPALTAHGIAVMQPVSCDSDGVHVTTILIHSGGGTATSTITLRPAAATPHAIGSCITYARRYSLMAICGIAPEDDDGNMASGLEFTKAKPTTPKPKAQEKELQQAEPKSSAEMLVDDYRQGCELVKTVAELETFFKDRKDRYDDMLDDVQKKIVNAIVKKRKEELQQAEPNPFDGGDQ